jgi:hypothetical protein
MGFLFFRMDKKKKKQPSEWSKTGSFMHKPDRGWIHPDGILMLIKLTSLKLVVYNL